MSEYNYLSDLTMHYPVSGIRAMFDLAAALGVLGWWIAWRGLRV